MLHCIYILNAIGTFLIWTVPTYLLAQVMETCIESKGWQKEGFAPSQVVTLNDREDGVRARFVPSSGDGWKLECQGKSFVGFQHCKTLFYQLILCTKQSEISLSVMVFCMCVFLLAFTCAGSAV